MARPTHVAEPRCLRKSLRSTRSTVCGLAISLQPTCEPTEEKRARLRCHEMESLL